MDLYSATTLYQQTVFEIAGLASGVHEIKIVRTGTKTAASTGTVQYLDALTVA